MISLDTNVVLRFLLDDVPDQTAKVTRLIEKSTAVYVTDVVIVEVLYVLEKVYGLPRRDICDLVTDFLGLSNVVHNPRFLLETLNMYAEHPALSIVDCYASEEARSYHNGLVTFGKRLANQGGDHALILA